jgi:uncharacterized protein YneF (UPF0154 family)
MAATGEAYIGRRSTVRQAREEPPRAMLEEDELLPPNFVSKLRYENARDIIFNSILFGVCLGYAISRKETMERVCDEKVHPVITWLLV